MKCKFGMPSLIEYKSIEENADLCRKLGLDFIELNMDLPYCLPSNNEISNILKIQEKYGIGLTMHFPEEIDFATFLSTIREANVQLFKEFAYWSSKVNIKLINLHLSSGVYFTLPNKKLYIYKDYSNEYKINLLGSFKRITEIADKNKIKLCVENTKMPDYIINSFEELSENKNIFFTWDVGHDAKDGYKAKEIFLKFPDKVAHMHLHDSHEKEDHLTLLKGSIDLEDRLKFAYRNHLSVVIETKTSEALIESVSILKSKLQKDNRNSTYSFA